MSKVALITGTSSGFGEMIAYQLADAGHIVYASMRGVATHNASKDAQEGLFGRAQCRHPRARTGRAG